MSDLDDLLRNSLHDERWTLAVPAGAMDRVRHGHRTRRRQTIALAAAGCLVAAGGFGALMVTTQHDPSDRLPNFASSSPQAVPVPGITPAFAPTSGREWVLSPQQLQDFIKTHSGVATESLPYPEPAKDPSITQASLLASVQAAGLPDGTRLENAGADGDTRIRATLPNGVQVDISRSRAQYPFTYAVSSPGQTATADTDPPQFQDVPGTTSTAAITTRAPYGFTDAAPGIVDMDGDGAPDTNGVMIVDVRGLVTNWYAYASVPLADLEAWAFTSAQNG